MAVEVGFYHCTRRPAPQVAVRLAEKSLASGRRLLIAAEDRLLDDLDHRLWVEVPESFLAHGRAGGPHAARQPILLAAPGELAAPAANGASWLMLVGLPPPEPLEAWERLFLLFEADTPAEAIARAAWRGLAGRAGVVRSYWQEGRSGGWTRREG